MKVYFDSHIFSYQKYGGISRYFVELIKNLPKEITCNENLRFTDNVYVKNNDKLFNKACTLPINRGKAIVYKSLNRPFDVFYLKRGRYDLFHPTYYAPYFLKYLKSPYVITVHDMIHEKFYNEFSFNKQSLQDKKKTILNASRIIAISENTKQDLMEIYGIPSESIDVVYHGCSIDANNIQPVNLQFPHYILFTGGRSLYKNWQKMIKAFAILHDAYPDIKMICTGTPFNIEEEKIIAENKLSGEVQCYFVSDAQLSYLYKHALCFVYPSLYEGFGIPILEAFATGCPLLLSNTSCFPEIAKDGGLYFNPNDIEEMAEAMKIVIQNAELRNQLIIKGGERFKEFSLKKMAEETSLVYKKAL